MIKYRAVLLFPEGQNEGRYEFDAPESFMRNSASRIIDTFLGTLEGMDLPGMAIENEINSSHSFRSLDTVTASGTFTLPNGSLVPFVAMISPAH